MESSGVITNATDWRSHAKQGRCIYNGLPITIENERGSYRQGTDDHGKPWRTFMHIAYGYIQLTEGVDGDHVDVYLGPNEFSNKAFVVHQVDPKTGKYDEDKVMLGFNDASAAKANYVRQYDSAKYFGTMNMYDMDTFKRMLVERRGLTIKKSLEKAKRMPVGTVSRGRKKVAEGKWVPVKKEKIGIKKGGGLHTDISKLITEERKAGVQYPIASAYENYYRAVKDAEGKRNILSITKELDDFLKLGDKYSLRDNKLADSIRDDLFELLIRRRREVIQPYPTEALEKFLSGIKKNIEVVYESKWDDLIKKDSDKRKVFQYVDSLVDLLKNPEVIGLYEESEFETIRAEAASYVTLISKTAKKRMVFPFDESKYMSDLKKIVKESLSSDSTDKIVDVEKFPIKLDRNELIDEFGKMADKHKAKGSKISDLTDRELFIFIAGKTLDYGRSVEDSLENAMYLMKDRKKAEQMFGTKKQEDLMMSKARKMPVGTISHGRKKVAEGKWVPVSEKRESGKVVTSERIDVKKTVDAEVATFQRDIAAIIPENMTEEQKVKLKEMINDRRKILTDILNGVNSGDLISFEGQGIMSGLDTYFRLAGYDIRAGEVKISKKGSNKMYMKPINDVLSRKEGYRLKKLNKSFPDMSLLRNDIGVWYLLEKGELTRFYWFHDLEKAIKIKSYYSPEEVKARGMRWVTIRGARVLIQGLTGGGWVVVGGAGGKLNHLKIDTILSKKEYAAKRKQVEAKRKEELRALTKEELAEQAVKRRAEIKAKRTVRQEYTTAITKVLGLTPEEIRSEVSAQQMDDLADTARQIVEARAVKPKDMTVAIEKQTQKELDKAVTNRVKSVERQALETLMTDYMREDPDAKPSLKELLTTDKALEILAARDQFRQAIREIGKGQADVPTTLKVGDITASESRSLDQEILNEVKRTIETQKNIRLYDTLNAQSLSIQKHIDQGSISAMNGLIGDLYGVGATFSTDTVENMGLEAVVRAVTIKIQQDGKGDAVSQALKEYAEKERERVVTEALEESERRFKNADSLRALARDTFDAEAILSMASANGHALKQLTAGQRALGSAVGSLRAVAAMINALEEPPADVVQVDIGKSLARARKKAKEAGLPRGSYSIKTTKEGRGKRLVLEIKKENLNTFFERNAEMRHEETQVDRIKKHLANDGYKPPGIKESIILDPAQEAGLRFFKEQDRVILDFEAGLGKTAVGYAAAMEAMKNKGAKKVLIVTPAKLRGQMYDERKVFLEPEEQTNVRQANENVSKADRLARYEKEGIMIVGHDQLRTDSAAIKKAGFDMIIVDEIHEMTAGTGTAGRFRGMMELKDIPLKIGMSGTNIKNKKNELYRKINFIDPDHTLGTMQEFDRRYKGLNQGTGMFSEAANDAFRKEIAQWMYTQKATLPVKNEIERFRIPLTTNQRKKYAASERTYRDEREKKLPGAAARRDARNYSIVTNEDAENNAKLNQLVKTMVNHDGEKAVVHVQGLNAMRTAKTRLEKEYGAGTVGLIHGESPPGTVRKLKAAFNDPANPLKFIVGTKSLESGHNLQGGGTVTFHLDIPDTYAAFEQRNKRIYRKGQDRDTKTYVLSGTNPLDIRKEDILETKRREMGILGNPRDIEGMDDSGFLGLLNKYEQGEALATA